MERNFYDMTAVSGKAVKDAKRIQEQTAEYLARHDAQLKESLQAEADAKLNAAMSGARFGYAANIARSNARINKLNEEIRYINESSVIGMTEMVAQVVEKALLLDESELLKIYPEYKEDIRSMVKGMLKEGDVNSTITNTDTLALMEYVSAKLPSVREGVSLTEDELSNYMAINKPLDIDKSIRNLAGDVSTRVATLMEKEQKKAEQIEKDVQRAKAKEAKMAANDEVSAEEIIQALEAGEISEDDLAEMLKNGEISQNTYDQVVAAYEEQAAAAQDPNAAGMDPAMQGQAPVTTSAEAPVEEDPNAAGMDPAMAGGDPAMMGEDPNAMGAEPGMEDPNAAGMDPAMAGGDPAMMGEDPNAMGGAPAGVAPGMPKKQIQMLPDGTMNINIYENDFSMVRETPRCGLIESLAVNEADTMIREGKEYDGDLCLAKAIMYVTITEAMDELGLMNVDQKKYSGIISAAGGSLNEEKKRITITTNVGDQGVDSEGNYGIINNNGKAVDPTSMEGGRLARKRQREKEKEYKKQQSFKKSKQPLQESILVNQYVPVRNDISTGESLADRIRKKRLNEQQKNLNE